MNKEKEMGNNSKFVIPDEYVENNKHLLIDAEIDCIEWSCILRGILMTIMICCSVLVIYNTLPVFKTLSVFFDMLAHLWF